MTRTIPALLVGWLLYGAPVYQERSLVPAAPPLLAAQNESVGAFVGLEGLDRLDVPCTDYNLNGGFGGY